MSEPGEITEADTKAYLWADYHRKKIDPKTGLSDKPLSVRLANLARDQLAARRKMEFEQVHPISCCLEDRFCSTCKFYLNLSASTQFGMSLDPRHNYDWPAWQASAHAELMGEGRCCGSQIEMKERR